MRTLRESILQALSLRAVLWASARITSGREIDLALAKFTFLMGLLVVGAPALAHADCLNTVSQVRANNVKTTWQETTENDGKPLIISIADGAHGLVYSAKKAGKVWLTGNVAICSSAGSMSITLKNTKATHNVPTIARWALPRTQSGKIVNNQVRLGGHGWSGTFVGV